MKKSIVLAVIVMGMLFAGCSQNSSDVIGEEKAKEIALSNAGLGSDEVTFIKANLERDDGKQIYDVEFYTNDFSEYDYEIDAATGDILSVDRDAEDYAPTAGQAPSDAKSDSSASASADSSVINEAKAKELALARVPGSTESDIREFRFEIDDGREVYEGKIVYNKIEYEFEIDAESGEFLSWETESK